MELTTTHSISFNLSPTEAKIIELSKGQVLKTLTKKEKSELAFRIWTRIKIKLGLRNENVAEEQAQIFSISDDLESFGTLTSEEVIEAVKRGLQGEYQSDDKQVFFNSPNFCQWLKKYRDKDKREVIGKVHNSYVETPPLPVPEDNVLKKQAIDILNDYADLISKNPQYKFTQGGLDHLYDIAQKFNLITTSVEAKKDVWDSLANIENRELRIVKSKSECYKRAIYDMVNFETRLDQEGKIYQI